MFDFPITVGRIYQDHNGSEVRVIDCVQPSQGPLLVAFRWLPIGSINEVTEPRFRQFFYPKPAAPSTLGAAMAVAFKDLEQMPPAKPALQEQIDSIHRRIDWQRDMVWTRIGSLLRQSVDLEKRIEKAEGLAADLQAEAAGRDDLDERVAAACERWLEARLKSELSVITTLFGNRS